MDRSWRRATVGLGTVATLSATFLVVTSVLTSAHASPPPPAVGTIAIGEASGSDNRALTIAPTETGRRLLANDLNEPEGVAVDNSGTAYVAVEADNEVIKIAPNGTRTVVVGSGLKHPSGIAVDADDDVFVSDTGNGRVIEIAPDGTQTIIASALHTPEGVAVDTAGNVYYVDPGTGVVRRIAPDGTPTNLATAMPGLQGIALDGAGNVYVSSQGTVVRIAPNLSRTQLATSLTAAQGLAADPAGDVYVGNTTEVIKVAPDGTQTTIPTSGLSATPGVAVDAVGDVYVANDATDVFEVPAGATAEQTTLQDIGGNIFQGAAYDAAGDLYLARGTANDRLIKIAPDGTVTPVTNDLSQPYGVAIDSHNNLYVTDIVDNDVVRISAAGVQTVIPTTGLSSPAGLALDTTGNLFVADGDHGRIVKITPDGTQSNVVTGLSYPTGVAVDKLGDLYVTNGAEVDKVTPGGTKSVFVAQVAAAQVAVDGDGNVFLTDLFRAAVIKAAPDGTMTEIGVDLNGPYALAIYEPSDQPPVATSSNRTVAAGESSGLTLSASDPDGDSLTYTVTAGPSHGTLSGTAPNLAYTPNAGYTGPDLITYSVDDGKGGTATGTVTITVSADGSDSVSQTVVAGQPVSTGDAPTTSDPVQESVTPSAGGIVTVTSNPAIPDPAGYTVVGAQVHIDAPPGSVNAPLVISFAVSAAALPVGEAAGDVTVFRDGAAISACTGAPGTASPDPCVASRTQVGDTITITVLSSHASDWTVAVPQTPTSTVLTGSPAGPAVGQNVTLRATVTPKPDGGTVAFSDGGVTITGCAAAAITTTGVASCVTHYDHVGRHTITATYSGDSRYAHSTSNSASVTVKKAGTMLVASAVSVLTSLRTVRVTYQATMTNLVTGASIANQPIEFAMNSGIGKCTAKTNTTGQATCSVTIVAIVGVVINAGYTANYNGSTDYAPSGTRATLRLL